MCRKVSTFLWQTLPGKTLKMRTCQCLRHSPGLYSFTNKHLSSFKRFLTTVTNISDDPECLIQREMIRYEGIGASKLIGPFPRFQANFKERYSHFNVQEIDPWGNRVRLTDIEAPESRMNRCQYIYFHLYKEGVEHTHAVQFFTTRLGIPPRHVHFAGMKDKHARTTQRFCLPSGAVTVHKLANLSRESTKTKLGNYTYRDYPLKLGGLKGNHFSVLLKNLQVEDSVSSNNELLKTTVKRAMDGWMTEGFVNYYGLQRFSTQHHKLGIAALQGKWEELFDMVLQPWVNDRPELVEAKMIWRTERDPKRAFSLLPAAQRRDQNVALLQDLSVNYDGGKGDLLEIYKRIPASIRSIHMSALNSYIWNKMATYRIEKFGLDPIQGDYVYVVPPFQNPCLSPTFVQGSPFREVKVKHLTKEDCTSNQYTIHDVLLPILGEELQEYPNPELQKYYQELLVENGLEPNFCSVIEDWGGRGSKASYRPLVVQPQNVDYKLIKYNDLDNLETYLPSDLQLLVQSGQISESESMKIFTHPNPPQNFDVDPNVRDKTCAVVEFSLPSGTYATIALREIMQCSNFKSTSDGL